MNERAQAKGGDRYPFPRPIALPSPVSTHPAGPVTADLKVFAASIYTGGRITALTVQSTLGVRRQTVSGDDLRNPGLPARRRNASRVKVGMLATVEAVGEVARF